MAGLKPPPRTLEPDEERKIQSFLERAAPIVLAEPVVDADRWRQLAQLAAELGLTTEQLRQILDDLCQRGVLRKLEIPVPQPPPLPASPAGGPAEASLDDTPEASFSLTPPPPLPVPSRRTGEPLAESAVTETFLRRAAAILARHRGGGPQAQVELLAAARSLGLSDEQAHQALQRLRPPEPPTPREDKPAAQGEQQPAVPQPPAPTPVGEGAAPQRLGDKPAGRKRWRVDGEAAPPAPPPPQEPGVIFRDYVRLALDQTRETTISAELEQRLISHGVAALGLNSVYARHLLQEVATEKGRLLAKEPTTTGGGSSAGPELVDQQLRAFLQDIAPILAEHRGINAKSRLLMSARARERGLSDEQMDQALALLQRQRDDGEETRQRERLAAFRQHAMAVVNGLPHPILTAKVEQTLTESGRLAYGVPPDRARAVIRDEARARNVAVISQERAEQHVRQLVEEWIGDDGHLDRPARNRVEAEGKQWGLSEEVVESIIRESSRTRIRQQLWERRVTGLALAAASLAVLFVIGFFSWTLLDRQWQTEAGPRPTAKKTTAPPALPPDSDNAWWDAGLSVAVANARVEMPQLLAPLGELDAIAPARRVAAYEALIQYLLDRTSDDDQRARLLELLARCYAQEPVEENADRIAALLLDRIPVAGTALSGDVKDYPKMFWALRTAVAALQQAKNQESRAGRMADALGRAVGTPIDRAAAPREMERQCLGGFAERLFRLLISVAAAQPPLASSLFGTISAEAVRYLDENLSDQLTAEFLVALLTTAADRWREYERQIRDLIDIADPAAVVKLVGLYEQTKDTELQKFMSGPLLQRAEVLGEATTVAGIAEAVRRKLGVSAESGERERWARWSRDANRALEDMAARSPAEEPPLEEIVGLAHFATLGCALSREELGSTTFDEILKKGPPILEVTTETPAAEDSSPGSRRGGTYDLVGRDVKKLSTQGGMVKRIPSLESLVAKTAVYPDITYRDAELLAEYLLSRKFEAEHKKVVGLVPPLAKWKHLRIALADHLEGARLERGQLQELLSAMLGKPITLGQGEAGREALRVQLLGSVIVDLDRSVAGSSRFHSRYDATRAALGSLYAVQAKLLGIKSDEASAGSRPSQILKPLIEQYAAQLQTRNTDAKAKEDLAGLSRRLKAIEYVAVDDLQLTVLLEREWAEVLARGVLARHPERKGQVEAALAQLRSEDRQAKQIVSQLRDGQAVLLRLWLLWNQPV